MASLARQPSLSDAGKRENQPVAESLHALASQCAEIAVQLREASYGPLRPLDEAGLTPPKMEEIAQTIARRGYGHIYRDGRRIGPLPSFRRQDISKIGEVYSRLSLATLKCGRPWEHHRQVLDYRLC